MSDDNELELNNLDEAQPTEAGTALTTDANEPEDDGDHTANELETVFDIPVQVSAVLGRSRMQVSQLMKLSANTVIELDRKIGEAIDIYVNNRLVARGEVVVVDERLGVTMTEIIKGNRG